MTLDSLLVILDSHWIGYVVNSLVWSAIGFVGGYVVCFFGHEIHEIRETVVDRSEQTLPMDRRRSDPLRRRNLVFGLVLILLAVGSVVATAANNERQDRAVDCQTEYNNTFSQILNARAKAAAQDRKVTQNLLNTVADLTLRQPPPPRAEARRAFRQAIRDYTITVRRNDRFRRHHPIPKSPKEACG